MEGNIWCKVSDRAEAYVYVDMPVAMRVQTAFAKDLFQHSNIYVSSPQLIHCKSRANSPLCKRTSKNDKLYSQQAHISCAII